jgi:hypothetical protein
MARKELKIEVQAAQKELTIEPQAAEASAQREFKIDLHTAREALKKYI